MKNALKYFYNIYCNDIIKRNNNYRIIVDNKVYYLIPYKGNINILNNIYDHLIMHNLYCHEIILNKDKIFITNIEGINYILIKIHCNIYKINYLDIVNYNVPLGNSGCNWSELWCKKIDYYEYQMNQYKKKYPLLYNSFSYYSGVTETAIMLVKTVNNKNLNKYIQHNRIYKNTSTLDFYNPINMIIDVKVRDICEYFKQQFFYITNPIIDIKNYFDYIKLSNDEAVLFLSRLIYPSYYFDLYDEIVQDKIPENKIDVIINKAPEYEVFLEEVYSYIKSIYHVPEIEWLIKV